MFYPVCSTAANIDQRRLLNLANPQANLSYVTRFDDGGTQDYNGLLLDMRWRSDGVVGPGLWEWDQAVSREFRLAEGQRLEIRAETFNVTNSLRRGNPGVSLASANTFGRILSSNGGPRIMQFALKYAF